MSRWSAASGLVLLSCAGQNDPIVDQADDPRSDTAIGPDNSADTGLADTSASDTSVTVPLSGWGEITGDCGVLDIELTSEQPALFRNTLDLGQIPFDPASLSDGGAALWDAGTLGGSSIHSEIIAYELLYRCELAELLKTEGEILYAVQGKKTDMLTEIDGLPIGVSVTRAVSWPHDAEYLPQQAIDLLASKLDDIEASTANVHPNDAWAKQILHVVAFATDHADVVEAAWGSLDPQITDDTLVVVTVTDGEDGFVY